MALPVSYPGRPKRDCDPVIATMIHPMMLITNLRFRLCNADGARPLARRITLR